MGHLLDLGRPVIVGFEASASIIGYLLGDSECARARLRTQGAARIPKDAQVILHMLKIGAT